MLEEKDAIQDVRRHYCKKAAQSTTQEHWMKHYGVLKAEPTKSFTKVEPRSSEPRWAVGFGA